MNIYEVIRENDGKTQRATVTGYNISEALNAMIFLGWKAEDIITVNKLDDEG